MTVVWILLVGVAGAIMGEGIHRRLARLTYRRAGITTSDTDASGPPDGPRDHADTPGDEPEEDEDETILPPPGPRQWVPIALGLAWMVVGATWIFGWAAEHVPWVGYPLTSAITLAAMSAIGIYLAAVDLDVKRLPDRAQLLLAAIALIGGVIAWWPEPLHLLIGLGWALGCGVAFWIIHIIGRGALGFGDVKLAVTCGWVLGLQSPTAVFAGFLLASLFAVLYSLVRREKEFAYGPWLLAGTFCGVLGF